MKRLTIGALAAALLLGGPFAGEALAKPSFQMPFQCNTKWRLNTWGHAPALDMVKEPNQVGTEGAPVLASADGVVNQSFYHSNAGNMIQINHGTRWFTTQIHLKSRSVGVGARVKRGQVIGYVGKTGPGANNHPHLHYEQAYDANNDGRASWGAPGTERAKVVFNGVTYGGPEHRNVTSRNC